jgi:hypothetical protein
MNSEIVLRVVLLQIDIQGLQDVGLLGLQGQIVLRVIHLQVDLHGVVLGQVQGHVLVPVPHILKGLNGKQKQQEYED